MRGQWISNWSARLEILNGLRLDGRFASLPDYAGATAEAGGENCRVRLIDGTIHTAEEHWYEVHGLGRRTQDKVSFAGLGMKRRTKQDRYFAVCINNKKYEACLEVGKLYRVIPDEEAESHGYLRVVDESGEEYGYSADRFFRLEVPRPLERALLRASS